jgi:hypothetical protein
LIARRTVSGCTPAALAASGVLRNGSAPAARCSTNRSATARRSSDPRSIRNCYDPLEDNILGGAGELSLAHGWVALLRLTPGTHAITLDVEGTYLGSTLDLDNHADRRRARPLRRRGVRRQRPLT